MLAPRLPCFAGHGVAPLDGLRQRLFLGVADEDLRERVRGLIASSYDNVNTYLYDQLQRSANGIAC